MMLSIARMQWIPQDQSLCVDWVGNCTSGTWTISWASFEYNAYDASWLAQSRWLKTVGKHMTALLYFNYTQWRDGSIRGLMALSCKTKLTKQEHMRCEKLANLHGQHTTSFARAQADEVYELVLMGVCACFNHWRSGQLAIGNYLTLSFLVSSLKCYPVRIRFFAG